MDVGDPEPIEEEHEYEQQDCTTDATISPVRLRGAAASTNAYAGRPRCGGCQMAPTWALTVATAASPRRKLQARGSRVGADSIAIVIGPTPPDRRRSPATRRTSSNSTSPRSRLGRPVHADVDHGRAGRDGVPFDAAVAPRRLRPALSASRHDLGRSRVREWQIVTVALAAAAAARSACRRGLSGRRRPRLPVELDPRSSSIMITPRACRRSPAPRARAGRR